MSEENIKIIESLERGFDAYSRGDFDAAVENLPGSGSSPLAVNR